MQAQAGLVNCTKPEMACVIPVYTAAKHVLHCATCSCTAFQRSCNCKKTSQLPSDVEKQMYVSACLAAVYTQMFCSLCPHFTPGLKLSLIMLHTFEVASGLLSEKFSSLWELLRAQFVLNCVCCIVLYCTYLRVLQLCLSRACMLKCLSLLLECAYLTVWHCHGDLQKEPSCHRKRMTVSEQIR